MAGHRAYSCRGSTTQSVCFWVQSWVLDGTAGKTAPPWVEPAAYRRRRSLDGFPTKTRPPRWSVKAGQSSVGYRYLVPSADASALRLGVIAGAGSR